MKKLLLILSTLSILGSCTMDGADNPANSDESPASTSREGGTGDVNMDPGTGLPATTAIPDSTRQDTSAAATGMQTR